MQCCAHAIFLLPNAAQYWQSNCKRAPAHRRVSVPPPFLKALGAHCPPTARILKRQTVPKRGICFGSLAYVLAASHAWEAAKTTEACAGALELTSQLTSLLVILTPHPTRSSNNCFILGLPSESIY
jgi:hypothetical protein